MKFKFKTQPRRMINGITVGSYFLYKDEYHKIIGVTHDRVAFAWVNANSPDRVSASNLIRGLRMSAFLQDVKSGDFIMVDDADDIPLILREFKDYV